MQRMMVITESDKLSDVIRQQAVAALEQGQVVLLPRWSFDLFSAENQFLTTAAVSGKSKNISYNERNHSLKGDAYQGETHHRLKTMLQRFNQQAKAWIQQLLPAYVSHLVAGRTSYRPVEAAHRENLSPRKDDRRLHVDAFPATPNQGARILRVFSNVNPNEQSRVWRLGDNFENVARYFLATLQPSPRAWRQLLYRLGLTRSFRTDYDAVMLQLHDQMKQDEVYQANVSQETIYLPSGSSWMVFTDRASHAAMSGQFCFEQTFYLPVEAMANPDASPLRILEKLLERPLR